MLRNDVIRKIMVDIFRTKVTWRFIKRVSEFRLYHVNKKGLNHTVFAIFFFRFHFVNHFRTM